MSMHPTADHTSPRTMKFKGQVGGRAVFALLDSCSTHSFVHPAVLEGHDCQITKTTPLIVMVANGAKMVTYQKCNPLKFSIQGAQLGSKSLIALLDSGSTHSFVNPQVLTVKFPKLPPVVVANGNKMMTDARSIGMNLSIQVLNL
jgi:hypothetical protein